MAKSKVKSKKAGSGKQTKKDRKQKKGNSSRFLTLFALGALLIIGGIFLFPYLQPVPEVSEPLDEEALDPAVGALIAPMIDAIRQDPRNAELRAELGMAYEANTLWNEARLSYANALALDDEEMAWHLHHAVATRESGDVEGALRLLKDASKSFPTSGAIYHRLAEALVETGELEAAEQAYRRLIELSPMLAQGYVGLADVMLQQGQTEEAIRFGTRGLELQPDYRLAHYVLGQAYMQAGRANEAEELLAIGVNASVDYVPDPLTRKVTEYIVNATGRLSMAQAMLDTGRPDDAATLLEETYRYHPSNIMLLNTLAVSYMRTRRLDQAERLLERARDLDEKQFYTYINLYNWALRSGKNELALAYADSSVARAPERDDTHLARAQALKELNRLDEAALSADKARELGMQNAANFGLSGDIAFQRGRLEEARTYFTTATDINPRLVLAWVGLARVHRASGRPAEAQEVLQTVQRIAPGHPAVAQLQREFSSL